MFALIFSFAEQKDTVINTSRLRKKNKLPKNSLIPEFSVNDEIEFIKNQKLQDGKILLLSEHKTFLLKTRVDENGNILPGEKKIYTKKQPVLKTHEQVLHQSDKKHSMASKGQTIKDYNEMMLQESASNLSFVKKKTPDHSSTDEHINVNTDPLKEDLPRFSIKITADMILLQEQLLENMKMMYEIQVRNGLKEPLENESAASRKKWEFDSGKVRLWKDFDVWIHPASLSTMTSLYDKPEALFRHILHEFFTEQEIAGLSAFGRGSKPGIPLPIYLAVTGYVMHHKGSFNAVRAINLASSNRAKKYGTSTPKSKKSVRTVSTSSITQSTEKDDQNHHENGTINDQVTNSRNICTPKKRRINSGINTSENICTPKKRRINSGINTSRNSGRYIFQNRSSSISNLDENNLENDTNNSHNETNKAIYKSAKSAEDITTSLDKENIDEENFFNNKFYSSSPKKAVVVNEEVNKQTPIFSHPGFASTKNSINSTKENAKESYTNPLKSTVLLNKTPENNKHPQAHQPASNTSTYQAPQNNNCLHPDQAKPNTFINQASENNNCPHPHQTGLNTFINHAPENNNSPHPDQTRPNTFINQAPQYNNYHHLHQAKPNTFIDQAPQYDNYHYLDQTRLNTFIDQAPQYDNYHYLDQTRPNTFIDQAPQYDNYHHLDQTRPKTFINEAPQYSNYPYPCETGSNVFINQTSQYNNHHLGY